MLDMIERKKGKWYETINKYRQDLDLTWEKLLSMNRKELKKCINKYDTKLWEKWIEESKVLKLYAKEKGKIGYEYCYKNNYNSKLYARARVNALQLEEHKGRGLEHYNTICKLCKEEEEDLVHFLIKCKALEKERNYEILENNTDDPELKARKLLFRNENIQEVSKLIRSLWECRKKLLKQIQTEDGKMKNYN